MNNKSFVIEITFNTPVARVWKAITDLREMKKWYFDLAEFRPEAGFEFQFWGQNEDRRYLHLCKITEVTEDKKITYSWRYKGFQGNSHVTFELFAEGSKTKLVLTHSGLNTFPTNNPDFAFERFAEGWTNIVGTSLREFIEK